MKAEKQTDRFMKNRTGRRSLLAVLCASLLAGCSPSSPAGSQASSSSTDASVSSVSSAIHADHMAAGEKEQDGYNAFAWNLFAKTAEKGSNSQISPLSAYYALGMCVNGAGGATRSQIEEMLGMDTQQINAQAKSLLTGIQNEAHSQLQLADSIWINAERSSTIRQSYQESMKEMYDADVFEEAFSQQTVDAINSWVAGKTENQIEKMISSLSADTVIVLLNALNFNAEWKYTYNQDDLADDTFHAANGSDVSMQFMHSEEDLYVEAEGLRGFIKPYLGERYGLAALIPANEEASIDEVLAEADGTTLFKALASPQVRPVEAALPSFEDSAEIPLNETLQAMGMTDAFGDGADFTGLSENGKNLAISEVLQKTHIKVDPKGTEAAAATEIAIAETALIEEEDTQQVICNRPFLYILLDLQSGSPLMMGVLQNPGAVEES